MIPIMKVEDYLVYSGFSFGLYCSVFRRYETLSSHMTTRSMGLSQMSFGGRMCTFVSCGAVVDIDLLLRSSDTEEVWQESSDPKLSLFLIFFGLISCSFLPSWKMVCSGLLDWAAIMTQTQWKLRSWRSFHAYLGNDIPLCLCRCCISALTSD